MNREMLFYQKTSQKRSWFSHHQVRIVCWGKGFMWNHLICFKSLEDSTQFSSWNNWTINVFIIFSLRVFAPTGAGCHLQSYVSDLLILLLLLPFFEEKHSDKPENGQVFWSNTQNDFNFLCLAQRLRTFLLRIDLGLGVEKKEVRLNCW